MGPGTFRNCTTNEITSGSAWVDIGHLFNGVDWTNYWFAGHTPCTTVNLYVAMVLIIDKINSMSGGAIDMGDILTAMLAATPDELTNFIGIEQAYMASIWNAPYNGEYYAALARGFRQWP